MGSVPSCESSRGIGGGSGAYSEIPPTLLKNREYDVYLFNWSVEDEIICFNQDHD